MKTLQCTILLTVFIFLTTFAKAPYTEFKIGYFDPKAAKPGYIFGANLGRMIDESLSWSFELNYFQKSYNKETKVEDIEIPGSGIDPEIKQLELSYKTIIVPIFLKLNYEHPLGKRSPFYARGSAGIGWELVWNKEDNYITKIHKTRFYHGFGWQGNLGIGLEMSSTSNLFADIMYNSSKPKRNEKKNEVGMPTWEELDISGFGIRVGVSIVGFGW
jgi:hypothetical protein